MSRLNDPGPEAEYELTTMKNMTPLEMEALIEEIAEAVYHAPDVEPKPDFHPSAMKRIAALLDNAGIRPRLIELDPYYEEREEWAQAEEP